MFKKVFVVVTLSVFVASLSLTGCSGPGESKEQGKIKSQSDMGQGKSKEGMEEPPQGTGFAD